MSLTIDEVNRVAGEYLQPDRMAIVVVGNQSGFDGQLSTLGRVSEINLDETF